MDPDRANAALAGFSSYLEEKKKKRATANVVSKAQSYSTFASKAIASPSLAPLVQQLKKKAQAGDADARARFNAIQKLRGGKTIKSGNTIVEKALYPALKTDKKTRASVNRSINSISRQPGENPLDYISPARAGIDLAKGIAGEVQSLGATAYDAGAVLSQAAPTAELLLRGQKDLTIRATDSPRVARLKERILRVEQERQKLKEGKNIAGQRLSKLSKKTEEGDIAAYLADTTDIGVSAAGFVAPPVKGAAIGQRVLVAGVDAALGGSQDIAQQVAEGNKNIDWQRAGQAAAVSGTISGLTNIPAAMKSSGISTPSIRAPKISKASKTLDSLDATISKTTDPIILSKLNAKKRVLIEKMANKNDLSVAERFNNLVVDRTSTLRNRFYEASRAIQGKKSAQAGLDKLELALGNAPRSSIMASQYMRNNGFQSVVAQVGSKARQAEFAEYLLAKQRQFRRGQGRKLSKEFMAGAEQDARTIDAFGADYEPLALELNKYSQDFLRFVSDPPEELRAIGMEPVISKEYAEKLIAENPGYVPLNKVLEEVENSSAAVKGKSLSISETKAFGKKFKGAAGIEADPLESIYNKTEIAFNEMARAGAIKQIKDMKDIPGNPLGIKILRDADDVAERFSIRKSLKESRPIKAALAKKVSSLRKKSRTLESELNELISAGNKTVRADINKELTRRYGRGTAKKRLSTAEGGIIPLESIVKEYIANPSGRVKALIKQAATRNKKLAGIASELDTLSDNLTSLNIKRRDEFLRAQELKDTPVKGKSVVSMVRNGITERIEVPDYIEAAVKGLNPPQASQIMRLVNGYNRLRKTFFTGASAPFAARNLPRDVQMKAVVGRSGAVRSLDPRSVVGGTLDALGLTGDRQLMESVGAMGNLVDTLRGPGKEIRRMRSSKNLGTKTLGVVKNPTELFRVFEDAVSVTETASRASAYRTRYRQVLKETNDPQEALRQATLSARSDSVDFFVQGELGDIIKAWGLYLNPSIQGTRRLAKAYKEAPIKTAARHGAIVVAPTIATTYWNMNDENRRAIYDDLQDWEKDSYNIIILPGAKWNEDKGQYDGVVRIPKTPGLSAIGNAAQELTERAMNRGINVTDVVAALGYGVFDTLNPESSVEGAITPDPTEPIVQQLQNKNFFTGKEIVPKDSGYRKAKEEFASSSAKKLSELLKKSGIEMSPLRIDAFIRDNTGGSGEAIQSILEKITTGKTTKRGVVEQIKGSFSGSYGGKIKAQAQDQLSGLMDERINIRSEIKKAREAGDKEQVKLLTKEWNDKVKALRELGKKKYSRMSDKQKELIKSLVIR